MGFSCFQKSLDNFRYFYLINHIKHEFILKLLFITEFELRDMPVETETKSLDSVMTSETPKTSEEQK